MSSLQYKYHQQSVLIEVYPVGDLVCSYCGLVVGDRVIDYQSEWRSFADDNWEKQCRFGFVETANHCETETSITIKQSKDTRHLDSNGNQKYKQNTVLSAEERMKRQCLLEIQSISKRLELNKQTSDEAMALVNQLAKLTAFNRKNKEQISCACLFIICRKLNIERTKKEISQASNVEVKKLGKMIKSIQCTLKLETNHSNIIDQINRFCFQLKIKNKYVPNLAKKLANDIKEVIHGGFPKIIACAIYIACKILKETIDIKDIAELMDIKKTAIFATLKKIHENKHKK